MSGRRLVLEGGGDALLVLLPGFLNTPAAYADLLAPLPAQGTTVVVEQLYARGPAALTGRFTVRDEARAAAEVVRRETRARAPRTVVLAGHSRGGQAAFLAADLLAEAGDQLDAVGLVDPVDGEGRAPSAPVSTVGGARFGCRAIVLGAALGGRCAPEPVNHEVFAAAIPQARHVVVRELGHTDMLGGRSRTFGRRLCGGADDPDPGRALCTQLLGALVDDDLGRVASPLLDWRR
jgi:pimeloyl-ACP methyl ester carboxylesterase